MPNPIAGGTVYLKFTTRNSSGVPTTLAGSPAISIYKDGSTTESTAGVTLTVDFDSRTGLNHIAVDTSADGTFYANTSTFYAVITTGTVSGTSVVGEVVGRFALGYDLVNVSQINSVATTSVTTVNANVGTTQPVNFTSTGASALIKSDMVDVAGAAVSTTTAQIGVNAVQINAVATTSVTTVNANMGTTQPINFTGTGASALIKSDMVDIAGSAVSTATAQIGVNLVNIRGTLSAGAVGYVGVDWGHVNAPTTTVALTGTTISSSQVVASVSGAVGSITGVTFPTNFSSLSIDASGRIDIGKILGTASAGAAGYVGIDWAHINAPTTTVALTGTTISGSQTISTVTDVTSPVTVGSYSTSMDPATQVLGALQSSWLTTGTVGLSLAIAAGLAPVTAQDAFPFWMGLISDPYSPATGLTVTAQRATDGGAFTGCDNAPTEIANGWYKINLTANDLTCTKSVALQFSATSAVGWQTVILAQ